MNWLRYKLAGPMVGALALAVGCAAPKGGSNPPAHTQDHSTKGVHSTAAKGKSQPHAEAVPNAISFEDRVEANARFAAGVALEIREERDRALLEFYKAALADWANEELVSDAARRLLAARQTDKAVEILAKCARRPDTSAPMHTLLAFAYRETGESAKAIAANRAALKKQPDYLPAFQSLVQIHLGAGKPEDAHKVLDEAARTVKDDQPETLLGLAETYGFFVRAAPDRAAEVRPKIAAILEKLSAKNSDSPPYLARLAAAYSSAGEFGKAAAIYFDLLKRVPNLPGLRERLIDAFVMDKDWKQASEQLETLVRQNPGNATAYLMLSSIAYEAKQLDRAADYLEKAILFKPDLEDAYYDLAGLKINQNKASEALDLIGRAKTQFKLKYAMEFYSGLACNQLKQYDIALKHFQKAEELAKKDDPKRLTHFFYFQMGAIQERLKDIKAAEESFQRCLKIDPDFDDALNYLGYMWAERGERLPEARKMIEKAVKKEPENAAYLDSMAWVLYKLKEPKQALEWMLKALKLTEEPDATLYDHLGDIYAALNRTEEARDAWQKALAIEASDAIRAKLEGSPSPK